VLRLHTKLPFGLFLCCYCNYLFKRQTHVSNRLRMLAAPTFRQPFPSGCCVNHAVRPALRGGRCLFAWRRAPGPAAPPRVLSSAGRRACVRAHRAVEDDQAYEDPRPVMGLIGGPSLESPRTRRRHADEEWASVVDISEEEEAMYDTSFEPLLDCGGENCRTAHAPTHA
jgi:hypothetical protein